MLWVVYKAPESPFLVVPCLDTHPHAFWHFSQKHRLGTRSCCLRESALVCSTSRRSWVLWFIRLLSEFITHWEGSVTSSCFLFWWRAWNLSGVFPRERWLLWGSFLWRVRVLWQKSCRPFIWSSVCRPFCRSRGAEGVQERARHYFSIAGICLPFSGKFCVVATSPRLVPRVMNPGSVFRHFDGSWSLYSRCEVSPRCLLVRERRNSTIISK